MKKSVTKIISSSVILLAMIQASPSVFADTGGVEYRISWDTSDSRYHVFLRPTTTPSPNVSYTGAQVTLKVPHALDQDKFSVVEYDDGTKAGITSLSGTEWYVGMKAIAEEADGSCSIDPQKCQFDVLDSDYITFIMNINKLNAFGFTADQEIEAFSFAVDGACNAQVQVMPSDDLFNLPENSIGTNPGNFFINSGWTTNASDPLWTSKENHYLGTYGSPVSCTDVTVIPAAPTVTSPNITNSTKPAISGTGEAGDTVTVKNNQGTALCSVTVAADNSWSCTPTSPLSEGSNTLQVTQTNPAGNTSPATSYTIMVDTSLPPAPTVTSPSVTNNTKPSISGTGEAGDTITVKDENGTALCSVTVAADNTWSCTPASPLSEGNHTLQVTQAEPTGNTSAAVSHPLTVDITAPAAPVVTSPTTSSSTTPSISGTGEAGATIKVTDASGKQICSATVATDNSWSCKPSTALSEGNNTLQVTQTDPAGNTSPATSHTITVDTTTQTQQVAVPTLTEWAQILMSLLLIGTGLWRLKRTKQ